MDRGQLARIAKQALPVAGVFLALLLAGLAIQQGTAWLKRRTANRQWLAVNNLTPERAIARCGQAAEDQTRDVFPVIMREMRFNSRSGRRVLLAFSRTAEQGSAWVLLSIKDAQTGEKYETPAQKIAALPCLDSRK